MKISTLSPSLRASKPDYFRPAGSLELSSKRIEIAAHISARLVKFKNANVDALKATDQLLDRNFLRLLGTKELLSHLKH